MRVGAGRLNDRSGSWVRFLQRERNSKMEMMGIGIREWKRIGERDRIVEGQGGLETQRGRIGPLPAYDRDLAGKVQAPVHKFSPVLSYRSFGCTVHPKLLPARTSGHCEQRRALQATPRNWRRETCNLNSHFLPDIFLHLRPNLETAAVFL